MTDSQTLPILEYTADGLVSREIPVIRETGLNIAVNGHPLVRLACTGKTPEYLAVGFLFSCGVIASAADITALHIRERKTEGTGPPASSPENSPGSGDALELEADVTVSRAFSLPPATITSGLGRSFQARVGELAPLPPVAAPVWTLPRLCELGGEFNARCGLYRQTRGCHSAALCSTDGLLLFQEDIGRHNAIDAIVGQCLLEGRDTSRCLILATGRIASEIVQKVVRARIPLLVSGAVATTQAVQTASRLGLGLVGNAKGGALWIYNVTGVLAIPTGRNFYVQHTPVLKKGDKNFLP